MLGHLFAGTFSEHNAPQCIAFAEMYSPVRLTELFASMLAGSLFFVITDSAAVFYAINAGMSHTLHVNKLLKRLSKTLRKWNMTIIAVWRPREFNIPADLLANGTHPSQHLALSLSNDPNVAS
jgi:hypothetical protein